MQHIVQNVEKAVFDDVKKRFITEMRAALYDTGFIDKFGVQAFHDTVDVFKRVGIDGVFVFATLECAETPSANDLEGLFIRVEEESDFVYVVCDETEFNGIYDVEFHLPY